MRLSVVMVIASAATIVVGLLLVPSVEGLGTGVALVGIAALAGFMLFTNVKAWRNGQGDVYTPGKARREARRDREAAAKRRRR